MAKTALASKYTVFVVIYVAICVVLCYNRPQEGRTQSSHMIDEKYQTVEEDKEYAQCIASVLNELIDQNVLTAHAVSTAEDESFFEFAMRFRREIVSTLEHPKDLSSFNPACLKKIGRIFSLPAAEAQNHSSVKTPIF